jgi:GT2 family glycosyltransferase
VIVVNYNCCTTLNDCVKSILLSDSVEELLLVDNASTDGSVDLLKKYNDVRLKIIKLNRNIGLAGARNLAAFKTRTQYIAFVDADSVVDREWLQEPCQLLEEHKEIGAVQCKILSLKYPGKISYTEQGMERVDWLNMSEEGLNFVRPILFPIGASIITRRDVWNLVQGFDSSFFVGHDDIDFGIRLWLSGYQVVCCSKGIVYHDGGNLRLNKDIAPIFQYYGVKNTLSIWAKDLQGKTIAKYVVLFSLLYPFQACWRARAVGVMAVIAFLRQLPSILIKRQEVQKRRRTSDEGIVLMLRTSDLLPVQDFAGDFLAFCNLVSRKIHAVIQKLG